MRGKRIRMLALALAAAAFLSLPVLPEEIGKSPAASEAFSGNAPLDLTGGFGADAECAFLFEPESGAVLLAQNADRRHGMASTTKIMTAVVALEILPEDRVVTIGKEMTGIEGSSVYLTEGERLTVRELLYALLLESGNDAAVALAIAAAGSVERFAALMNCKAAFLGLQSTHFVNPHGLPDGEHYTTARELGLIAAYALRNGTFRQIVSTFQTRIPYRDIPDGRSLTNHNPILNRYEGLIGVKTGWTPADGKCFVSAAERDGMTLVAVTLGDTGLARTHTLLLNHGFASFAQANPNVPSALFLPLVGGEKEFVAVRAEDVPRFCLPKNAVILPRIEAPAFLYAGVREGECVGRIVFLWEGKEIGQCPLVAAESTAVKRISFWKKMFGT